MQKVPRANFNASGRGFPDISAVGVAFQIVVNGNVSPVGGTSASSPTFGAILSLVNSERLSKGKKTLGWANPLLHAAAAVAAGSSYHDVTQGNNAHGQCDGFNATVGWDPMTGTGPDSRIFLTFSRLFSTDVRLFSDWFLWHRLGHAELPRARGPPD